MRRYNPATHASWTNILPSPTLQAPRACPACDKPLLYRTTLDTNHILIVFCPHCRTKTHAPSPQATNHSEMQAVIRTALGLPPC